jgi:hypothetical protein
MPNNMLELEPVAMDTSGSPSQARDDDEAFQVEFLHVYLEDNGSIDVDVLEVGDGTWVIHGVIPYGGEVPMAVFRSYADAKRVLDQICAPHRDSDEV